MAAKLKPLGVDLGWFFSYHQVIDRVREMERGLSRLKTLMDSETLFETLVNPADPQLRNYFLLLEQIVLNDQLVVDAAALERLNWTLPRFTEGLILPVHPPPNVYLGAEKRASTALRMAWELADAGQTSAKTLLQRLNAPESESLFVAWEKRLHDQWYAEHMRGSTAVPTSFADSSNSIGRAFFYLELGQSMGVDLMLSPPKQEWLALIGNALTERNVKSTHDKIVKLLDKKVLSLAERGMQEFTESEAVYMPPITALIAKLAVREGCSFEDAALEIRGTEQAAAYRKLVHEIRAGLLSKDRHKGDKAARQLSEIDRLAEIWKSEGVSDTAGYCVKWHRTALKALGNLLYPGAGTLADSGLQAAKIKLDAFRKPEPHVSFMASWYAIDGLEISDPRETRNIGWET